MKIKDITYNILKDETTIFFIKSKWGKEKEDLKTFKGKIKFKGKNPTLPEVLIFIELKGGLKNERI